MTGKKQNQFGEFLRAKRMAKKISLRKFADQVGISPTYLSQVEQGNVDPPTADRVSKMAEILGESADEMIALAGRVPGDLPKIIQSRPEAMPALLRSVSGMSAEQLKKLMESAERMKKKDG